MVHATVWPWWRAHSFDVAKKQPAPSAVIRGLPASAGSYEGRARVVLGADQFSRIEKGDVLIARQTSPSYNVLCRCSAES
ncbi:MAG: hypothetical protein AB7P03_21880 [Kofleriaceae bacterium]